MPPNVSKPKKTKPRKLRKTKNPSSSPLAVTADAANDRRRHPGGAGRIVDRFTALPFLLLLSFATTFNIEISSHLPIHSKTAPTSSIVIGPTFFANAFFLDDE
jgi:hypothetical protein